MIVTQENKYKQIGLLSTFIAEVVVTPCILGGVAFYFAQYFAFNNNLQLVITTLATLLGLGIGFYRIILISKKLNKIQSKIMKKSYYSYKRKLALMNANFR